MESQPTKEFYDFGEFRLDARNRLLWREGKTVPLTVKEFEVLFFLVENAGSVVEKDALLDAIWKETFVEEATLMQNISRLRRKLEAASSGEKYIETLPKRGYRFLPEVVKTDENALVIEEQTIQRVHIEERVEILPSPVESRTALFREGGDQSLETENQGSFARNSNLLPAAPTAKMRFPYLVLLFGVLILAAINYAVYRIFFYNREPPTIQLARLKPFSGLPGREGQPAFSPDGKQIAFIWNGGEQGDNTDIYVKLIGAGDPVRLTRHRADEVSPAFSPDGKTIAFVRILAQHGEIYTIPALGGAERKICDTLRSSSKISFSADGRALAIYDGDGDGRNGIFTVSVETGEKKRLTAPPNLTADDQPAFSPDGKQIAFMRSFAHNLREIFVVPATGGKPLQVTFDKAWIGGMAWSADSQRLVFASRRNYNGRANLWRIEAAGGTQPALIAASGERLANLAISPDDRTIAFVEESYDTNIWRIEAAKATESETFRTFAPSSGSDNSPQFSPDGKQVVFASDRSGKYDVWISDADGANARQLTDIPKGQAGSPRFSPDGRQIVFDAQMDGNGDIYTIPANGGAMRRVTDAAAFDYLPAWSAGGNSIYFASNRSGTPQIYRIPAAGGEIRQITQNGGGDSFASPDGQYLYFRKGRGSREIWRVAAEGGEDQVIPELAEAGYWRSWTMTKSGIYFVQYAESAPYKIMFYDFSIGKTKETTSVENAPLAVYPGLGVSEDGTTVLLARNDQNASRILLAEVEK